MSLFRVGCRLAYELPSPCVAVFNVAPVRDGYQIIHEESYDISPGGVPNEQVDPITGARLIRLCAAAGPLKVSYRALVEVKPLLGNPHEQPLTSVHELPIETLSYLNPSRYCESDRLARMASDEFGRLLPDYSLVTGICNWIWNHVEYLRGTSTSITSAFDVATQRSGVCRDFAHLAIAFCRALNIPARFVSAYAMNLVPPDFHALFEAYLNGRWWLFDATRQADLRGLVRISYGKDAADCSFATFFGAFKMTAMEITMEPEEAALEPQTEPVAASLAP